MAVEDDREVLCCSYNETVLKFVARIRLVKAGNLCVCVRACNGEL
jgi:hypothetical protein